MSEEKIEKKDCALSACGQDNIPPFNLEHSEAVQIEVDKRRLGYFKTLPPDKLKKHLIIEECVKKLEENEICFSLLASPSRKCEEDGFWSYHKLFYDIPSKETYSLQVKTVMSASFSFLSGLSDRYIMASTLSKDNIFSPCEIHHKNKCVYFKK